MNSVGALRIDALSAGQDQRFHREEPGAGLFARRAVTRRGTPAPIRKTTNVNLHPPHSFVIQTRHAREHLAFKQFQGSAAAGGDMRHLVGQTALVHSADGVPAADDADRI